VSWNLFSLNWWRTGFLPRKPVDLRRDLYFRTFHSRSKSDQWKQWQLDVEQIKGFIIHVFNRRYVYRELVAMFEATPALAIDEARFTRFYLTEQYGHYIAMAVRREVDRGFDVLSLGRLLDEIKRAPGAFSRERYYAHFTDEPSPIPEIHEFHLKQRSAWWKDMAGEGDCIDVAVVKKDLRRLDRRAKQTLLYANKIVAHRALKESDDDGTLHPPSPAELAEIELTVAQVDEALDNIEAILKKYYVLLSGNMLTGAEPTMQYHWRKVFESPWMSKEYAAKSSATKLAAKQAQAKAVLDAMIKPKV
jgi:hypothetical protein